MTTNKERKWPAGTADKMNEWAERQLGLSLEPWQMDLLRQMEVSKPRTLADMTHEEREACRWMQADYEDGFTEHPVRVIITVTYPNVVDILLPNGTRNCVRNEEITPLPDLPRMAWPEEQATNHYTNQEKK